MGGGGRIRDAKTGVLVSPVFLLEGDTMSRISCSVSPYTRTSYGTLLLELAAMAGAGAGTGVVGGCGCGGPVRRGRKR